MTNYSEPHIVAPSTDCEDFNFAEVHPVVAQRKLDDDESEAQLTLIDAGTSDRDRRCGRYSASILTTQRVVPQDRCVKTRMIIRQTDDEVVRSISCKQLSG